MSLQLDIRQCQVQDHDAFGTLVAWERVFSTLGALRTVHAAALSVRAYWQPIQLCSPLLCHVCCSLTLLECWEKPALVFYLMLTESCALFVQH